MRPREMRYISEDIEVTGSQKEIGPQSTLVTAPEPAGQRSLRV